MANDDDSCDSIPPLINGGVDTSDEESDDDSMPPLVKRRAGGGDDSSSSDEDSMPPLVNGAVSDSDSDSDNDSMPPLVHGADDSSSDEDSMPPLVGGAAESSSDDNDSVEEVYPGRPRRGRGNNNNEDSDEEEIMPRDAANLFRRMMPVFERMARQGGDEDDDAAEEESEEGDDNIEGLYSSFRRKFISKLEHREFGSLKDYLRGVESSHCCGFEDMMKDGDYWHPFGTALHAALQHNPTTDLIDQMLKLEDCKDNKVGISMLDEEDDDGNTPLHTACQMGCLDPILRRFVVERPDSMSQENNSDKTPIEILYRQLVIPKKDSISMEEYIKFLPNVLEGAFKGKERSVPQIVNACEKKKVNVPEFVKSVNSIPKMRAAWKRILILLTSTPLRDGKGVIIALTDQKGITHLNRALTSLNYSNNWADEECATNVIKTLIRLYPDQCKAKCYDGNYPLLNLFSTDISADYLSGVVEVMLNIFEDASRVQSASGENPLHVAIMNNCGFPVYQELLKYTPKALKARDPKTHLYPFQSVASNGGDFALTLSYQLLRLDPLLAHGLADDPPWVKHKRALEEANKKADKAKRSAYKMREENNRLKAENADLKERISHLEALLRVHGMPAPVQNEFSKNSALQSEFAKNPDPVQSEFAKMPTMHNEFAKNVPAPVHDEFAISPASVHGEFAKASNEFSSEFSVNNEFLKKS